MWQTWSEPLLAPATAIPLRVFCVRPSRAGMDTNQVDDDDMAWFFGRAGESKEKSTPNSGGHARAPPQPRDCDHCEHCGGRKTVVETSSRDLEASKATWADVRALPPLPKQHLDHMRKEARRGKVLVSGLIVLFCAPVTLSGDERTWIYAVLIYTGCSVAFACLVVIMWSDPGVVKRSPERCFPQPKSIIEALSESKGVNKIQGNVKVGEHVFCGRCLVWRPAGTKVHHCSICNRCVYGFDHHCGVFGRCIAAGNIRPFGLIIMMGFATFWTWLVFLSSELLWDLGFQGGYGEVEPLIAPPAHAATQVPRTWLYLMEPVASAR